MKNILLVLVVIGVVCGNDFDLAYIDAIVEEMPCLQEGGSCTIAADCPKGQLVAKQGLCPAQQKQGIECCYGVSVKETRCAKRGGSCMPREIYCRPSVVFQKATDCAKNQKWKDDESQSVF